MIRIYVSADYRITPETIGDVFTSHGDRITDEEIQRIGECLEWKDPVLATGHPEWDTERGNPLFHVYQAVMEGDPVRIIPVFEPVDIDNLRWTPALEKMLDGYSVRSTPFDGYVGLPPSLVIREAGPPCSHEEIVFSRNSGVSVDHYDLDGFLAFDVRDRGGHRIAITPDRESAHAAAFSHCAPELLGEAGSFVVAFDNDGATFDRYTLLVKPAGKSVFDWYTLSDNADSPQGVCQYGGEVLSSDFSGSSPVQDAGLLVKPEDLPEGAKQAFERIMDEYGVSFEDTEANDYTRTPEPEP